MIALETKAKAAIGLSLAFIVLNVVDILLTWQGLGLGAIELNVYMQRVLGLGFLESIAFKVGVASGLAAIMLHKGQFISLIIGVSLVSLVCVWNLNVIANLS